MANEEENGRGEGKGAWEAASTILKGSVVWSRGGGQPGVAPCSEEVGERRGRGSQHDGRAATAQGGRSGATMADGRALAIA
jgi:hypothetical protein